MPEVTAAWPPWLGPKPPVTPGTSTALLPIGPDRPVLRVPDVLGIPVAGRLLGDCVDRLLVGAILHHRLGGVTYWFIARGATDEYPPGCRLLTGRAYVAVPAPDTAYCTVARWLHLPAVGRLTSPPWLAHALNAQHATTLRPGAAAMTQPIAPARCEMCTEPPSRSGPVMAIGPDGRNVDMGHPICFARARLMATAPDRTRVRA
jgi:hypothetical protein